MQRYRLTIRYDGLLAAEHEMDAGDSHIIIEGAKRLLAANGYYWTTGKVPDRLYPKTDAFHVRHTGMRAGSCEYEFTINLLANGVWEIARLTFEVFVIKAFLDWRDQREFEIQARREPYFDVPRGRSNSPAYDFEADPAVQYRRLQERHTQSMNQITVPLGRHATSVELGFQGTNLGTWTRRVPRWTEDEISEAVRTYRSSTAWTAP